MIPIAGYYTSSSLSAVAQVDEKWLRVAHGVAPPNTPTKNFGGSYTAPEAALVLGFAPPLRLPRQQAPRQDLTTDHLDQMGKLIIFVGLVEDRGIERQHLEEGAAGGLWVG